MDCLSTSDIKKSLGSDSMLRELATVLQDQALLPLKGHGGQGTSPVTGRRPLKKCIKEGLCTGQPQDSWHQSSSWESYGANYLAPWGF